jgi:antirestriction protein ArdC
MSGPELRRSLVCRLISCLGAGQIPWLPRGGFPANVFDRRRYEGDSALALLSEAHRRAYASRYWGSRRQWEYLGGRVSGEPVALLVIGHGPG